MPRGDGADVSCHVVKLSPARQLNSAAQPDSQARLHHPLPLAAGATAGQRWRCNRSKTA